MPEVVNTSALSIDSGKDAVEDNRPVMIKVDHVSMVFNKASEQLNNLKEYAIKIARRELFFEGFKALDDVSFEVRKGDVFGIMGTNGSGKSTILKIIAGVLEPTSGSCQINGHIAPLIELGAGFDMDLTARENIYLNGALLGYSKEFINSHFDEIVDFAEIESFLDMPLKNYSSGMVARIAFAIATVIVPEILVVDEVLSVGDFMFQKKCEDRINELIEQHGVTVLIVSHSNDQIARLCNKAIWIEKGHTRLMGDASMVTRVYGGLGGRTGSAEAEARVFEALKRSAEVDLPANLSSTVYGDSAISTCAKMVSRAWGHNRSDMVVIACNATHANSIVANAYAAHFGAPILSESSEGLSDAVEKILIEFKPEKIVLFDTDKTASELAKQLSACFWNPEVIHVGEPGEQIRDYSSRVFRLGAEKDYWGEEVAFVHFDDNAQSLVASPFFYDSKCPVVLLHGADWVDYAAKFVAESGVRRIFCFGQNMADLSGILSDSECDITMVGAGGSVDSCGEILRFVAEAKAERLSSAEKREVFVASQSLGQWPELVSCGCSISHSGGIGLMLVDNTNLESMKGCLDFVLAKQGSISRVVFIGLQHGLTAQEREMLLQEMI